MNTYLATLQLAEAAAAEGNVKCIKMSLPNQQDERAEYFISHKQTKLSIGHSIYLAAKNGHADAVECLLSISENYPALDEFSEEEYNDNLTDAIYVANRNNFTVVVNTLEKIGVKIPA